MHDVIIVGGGPVGSQTAYRLSGAGHKVLVLEKKSGTGQPVCCTGIISQDCVQTFNVDDSVILRRLNSARLYAPGGAVIHLWRPAVQANVVDRVALDIMMARRAQAAGTDYRYDCSVHNIEVGRDAVTVYTSNHHEKHTYVSRSVVIAGGHGAKIITIPETGTIDNFTTGVQAEVAVEGLDEVEVYFSRRYAPGFFAWLVPTSQDKGLAGAMVRHNAAVYLKELLEYLASQGRIKSANVPIGTRTMPLQLLSRPYGRRMIFTGSVAGQVKPITGGGLYYGMLCADVAAKTLHRALSEDDLSAARLSSYFRECNRTLGQEIKTSSRVQKLFERLNDRQLDKLFDIIGSGNIVESLLGMEELSFDWHGRAIKRLLREKALTGLRQFIKVPFN